MATLEWPRELAPTLPSGALESPALIPALEPDAVPRHFDTTEWHALDSDDLISLGEEQLFTGARTRRAIDRTRPASSPLAQQVGTAPATPVVSEELYRSLLAAKQSFVLALNGLLYQHFESMHLGSPEPIPNVTNGQSPQAAAASPSSLESNPYASISTEPDALLATIVSNLRAARELPAAKDEASPSSEMQSLGSSPFLGSVTSQDGVVEELQVHLDGMAAELAPVDAELAHSLGALLACIERLLEISRVHWNPSSSPVPVPTEITTPGGSVYRTLEREARLLQSAWGDLNESVVGAAREVEIAERDLLWGRVDDLSERVGILCRQRAEEATLESDAVEGQGETPASQKRWEASQDTLFHEAHGSADLPRYSMEIANRPPAYMANQQNYTDAKHDWEKLPFSSDASIESSLHLPTSESPRSRRRRTSHANSGQTQRDLESVSLAIERLYIVSPQLANQRVEPDRRGLRERQLAKLGNAIERLSKGRLDDQRATPSPVPSDALEGERALRIQRIHDAALDKLIYQIDRAASRTLTDQRVDLKNMKRKDRVRSSDTMESQRRDYILEHTGKGRLTAQDSVVHPGLAIERIPRPLSPSEVVTITEFFRSDSDEWQPRRDSFPVRPAIKKRLSDLFQGKGDDDSNANAAASGSGSGTGNSKKSLRLGMFRRGSTPTMSRRGSYDWRADVLPAGLGLLGSGMSRSSSMEVDIHATSSLDYICEESRNLGTIVISFWPRATSPVQDSWEVVLVEGDTILVGPVGGGSTSRIMLPSRVIPQTTAVIAHGSFFEIKLTTSSTLSTRSRSDLEVQAPLSPAELREALPRAFLCATCSTELADTSSIAKYNALPSEHWAELLDAWMCHQDQRLSEDLIAKGKGIKPRADEGLVGSTYLLVHRDYTKNWITPEGAAPVRSEGDDLLYPAHCTTCDSLVGQHVISLAPSSDPTHFRLIKYATFPSSPALSTAGSQTQRDVPKYNLASHLTSELLEIGQAHACHRFLVQDAETETVRLLLWLFNPAVKVSFLTASGSALVLEDPRPQNPVDLPGKLVARTMNAVKVFYAVVTDEQDSICQDFMLSEHSTPERVSYPLAVTQQLKSLLVASNALFPPEKREWGQMGVGFLERI